MGKLVKYAVFVVLIAISLALVLGFGSANLTFASRKDQPILHSTLEQGLAVVSGFETQESKRSWTSLGQPSSLWRGWGLYAGVAVAVLFLGVVVSVWTISVRRLVAKQVKTLSKSEGEYQKLFEHMLDGLAEHEIILDADGKPVDYRFLSMNPAFEALTGLKADELIGKTVLEVLPKTELIWIEKYGEVALGGEPVQFESYSQELGKHFKVYAYCPEPGKFACVFQDITARKQAEEALENRLVALTRPLGDTAGITFDDLFNLADIQRLQDEFAQATGVASIITQPDGTPITVPSNFCRLCKDIIRKTEKGLANCKKSDAVLGRLSDEKPTVQTCMSGGLWDAGAGISVGGRHVANWLIGQVRDETQTEEEMREYAREINADENEVAKAFYEVPSMSYEQFEQISQMLFTIAKQLSASAYQNVQQARFIAERKKAEEERNLLNDNLIAKNAELEQVFYVASHDLRSPLVNIDGYSKELVYSFEELLRILADSSAKKAIEAVAPLLEKDIYEALRFIRASASKMDSLLTGLLRLSRLGRAALTIETLDMNELIGKVIDACEFQVREAKVELEVADLPPCQGDEVQVNQLFSNLLDNALKYLAPDRPGVIRISGRVDADKVVYCVEDNGMGIASAHQEKIFDIFHRLDPTHGQGEGIGLTLVKRIVGRLGGDVWIESGVGSGSCFYLALPAGPV